MKEEGVLITHLLSKENIYQWCCDAVRFCALPVSTNLWQALRVFSLFRLFTGEPNNRNV